MTIETKSPGDKAELNESRRAEQRRRMGQEFSELITPERIAEHRKRLGSEFGHVRTLRNINTHGEVTWDAIMRWSESIGDLNPLYLEMDYAKKTRYGMLAAHPTFCMSIHPGGTIQGLPGVHIAVGGFSYEFIAPLLAGDKISFQVIFSDLIEKTSSTLGGDPMLIEHYDTQFRNQYGQLVVREDCEMLRFGRSKIESNLDKKQKASTANMPTLWTEEQVRAFEDAQLNEQILGDTPRYWEDVEEGQSLPDATRGPVTLTDLIAQLTSFSIWKSGPCLIKDMRKHPGYAYFHPTSRGYEHLELIHNDDHMAHAYGFAHPYDSGHVRSTLIAAVLTHWAGDHAWLKRLRAHAKMFFYCSDVVTISTKITRKYVDVEGEYCIDLESSMINKRDELIMPGSATIALPSREAKTWPVEHRMIARSVAQAKATAGKAR